jgi:Tol biopolymer transport system component
VVATGVAWSPDGEEIAYSTGKEVFLADRTGESPRKIATVEGLDVRVYDWSSEGWISLGVYQLAENRRELWQVRRDGSEINQPFPDWPATHIHDLESSVDGRHLFFVSGWEHTGEIWTVRQGASEPVPLTKEPMRCGQLAVDPGTERLYASCFERRGELFVYRPEIDEWLPYPFPAEPSARHLSFSRDGEWAAWVKFPEGTLWRSRRDGTSKLQLTRVEGFYAAQPRWSPDGKRIAFAQGNMMAQLRGHVVGRDGAGLRAVTEGPSLQNQVDWSPDGRVVVSFFGDDVGPLRLVDLETGETEELPGTEGLAGVASSPDGRYLAAHDLGAWGEKPFQVRVLEWETGEWRTLEGVVGGMLKWSADGAYLYFSCRDLQGVCRVRPQGGEIERVATFTGIRDWWWSVDPDGRVVRLRGLFTSDIFTWDLTIP